MLNIPNVLFTDTRVNASLDKMYKGAVNSNGTWHLEPASGWVVNHLSTGIYRVSHYQANPHYSVNISAMDLFGTPNILQMTDMFFDVAFAATLLGCLFIVAMKGRDRSRQGNL